MLWYYGVILMPLFVGIVLVLVLVLVLVADVLVLVLVLVLVSEVLVLVLVLEPTVLKTSLVDTVYICCVRNFWYFFRQALADIRLFIKYLSRRVIYFDFVYSLP